MNFLSKPLKICCILFIILISSFFQLFAQTGQIRGFVFDKKNGEPIIFTNVYLKGTSYGASTDVNGYYVITKIPEGNYMLLVTAVGYDSLKMNITINKNDLLSQNLYITEASYTLETVQISAEREERKTETRTSVLTISPKQIEQIPSIGGQADLAQYLQVIPGIVFTGDQGGQLYIRGGSPIQNKVLMDGVTIYNPFHSIGLFSVIETDLIRNADIYTGGFNAQYGGRISSIMDISMRDGNKKNHAGKLQATTFGANILVEGPFKKSTDESPNSVTYILSAKNSYLQQTSKVLYKYADENGLPFNFLDLYGKLTISTDNGSKVNFFGFRYDDSVDKYKGLLDYAWTSYGAGLNFVVTPERASTLIEGGVSFSNYQTTMNTLTENAKRDGLSSIFNVNARMDFTHFFGKGDIKAGFDIAISGTNYEVTNDYGIKSAQDGKSNEFAAYVKYKGTFGKVIIEPGFRLQYYASYPSAISPEPRLSLKYNITDWLRFKTSGGLYSQNLMAAASDRDVVNLFYGFLISPSTDQTPKTFRGKEVTSRLQKAYHIVGGFEVDINRYLALNIEGYYKDFSQLTSTNRNKLFSTSTAGSMQDPTGIYSYDYIIEDGHAEGLDLSLKLEYDRLYLWTAYSFAFVHRRDELMEYTPHYDRRHNLNVMATYKLGKSYSWELSARWNFGTGFPFTPTAGYAEKLNFDNIGDDYISQNGDFVILYGDLYSSRLTPYHRLDLNIKKTFYLGQHTSLDLDLGVTNVYNRKNIFYYERTTNSWAYQLPILPNFGITFRY
ncbi:MAG: TonB-dependent receptor [Bacteroidales bacterium]|nr:TonB-dependent receptor [Bacteroidales bacterium]